MVVIIFPFDMLNIFIKNYEKLMLSHKFFDSPTAWSKEPRGESQLGAGDWAINWTLEVSR